MEHIQVSITIKRAGHRFLADSRGGVVWFRFSGLGDWLKPRTKKRFTIYSTSFVRILLLKLPTPLFQNRQLQRHEQLSTRAQGGIWGISVKYQLTLITQIQILWAKKNGEGNSRTREANRIASFKAKQLTATNAADEVSSSILIRFHELTAPP